MKGHKYIRQVSDISLRVKITVKNEIICKIFLFDNFGGKQQTLKFAIKWRDNILKKNNLLDRLKTRRSCNMLTNNITPLIGVFDAQNNGYPIWVASYSKNGVTLKKRFSILKHGNCKAFNLACEYRYNNCGLLRVNREDLLPCLPNYPYIIL